MTGKGKGKAAVADVEVVEGEAQVEGTEATETEVVDAEPQRNYHEEVTNLVQGVDAKEVKLAPSEERIGRHVAVTVTVGENSVTAPRQLVIQALFELNWHRRAITDLFEGFEPEVPYQIVFAATKNQENEHHKAGTTASPGTGTKRGKSFQVLLVDSDTETELTQADYIRALAQGRVQGKEELNRSDIAELLSISYGTVYQATKEMEMPDGRKGNKGAATEEGGEAKPKKQKTSAKEKKMAHTKQKAPTEDLPDVAEDVEADADLMP